MFGWFKKYEKLLDRELVDLFKSKNDMDALGVLFSRYSHLVAAIAMGILKDEHKAKEVVQDIFEVIVKDLKKHTVKNFNSWIYSVSKFHCFKVKKTIDFGDLEIDVADEEDADENFERELHLQKQFELLNKALGDLKGDQRDCIKLFYIEGLSYNEVANKLDFTIKDVKSKIQNGKRNLKLLMTENE